MTTFLTGFCGALAALGLLALGALAGWQGRRVLKEQRGVPPVREKENRRLQQEQQAFRQLQNYSAQRAYGLVDDEEGDD